MSEEKFKVPAASFRETPDGYEIKVQLPGIGKEDAELKVEGRTLTLKTAAKFQNPAGFRQVAAEFERQNFAMSADLPEKADTSSVKASLENGIMTIAIGKRPETQAKKIEIS